MNKAVIIEELNFEIAELHEDLSDEEDYITEQCIKTKIEIFETLINIFNTKS